LFVALPAHGSREKISKMHHRAAIAASATAALVLAAGNAAATRANQ
jgi:hypothetical protein